MTSQHHNLCLSTLAQWGGHLEPNSPEIRKHHTNWRLRALQSLEIEKKYDLHYSLGMTVFSGRYGALKSDDRGFCGIGAQSGATVGSASILRVLY